MSFQKIVLSISIVIFIILMIFIGSVLYKNKYSNTFPPIVSECPDYWIDRQKSMENPDADSDDVKTAQSCFNVKNLGNTSCSKTMDFTGDFWQGSTGACNKYKWAKKCDLTWDGITNSSNSCDNNNNNNS